MKNELLIAPIKWQAPEFEYIKKSSEWFWAFWIITLGVIVVSLLFNNILFAILAFFIAFTLSLQSTKRPKMISFEISNEGITASHKKYFFKKIRSYWIQHDEKFPQILLRQKQDFLPLVIIPLGGTPISKIEGFLASFLKKEEITEPLPFKIMKYF